MGDLGLYLSALVVFVVVLWALRSSRRANASHDRKLDLIATHICRQERPRLRLLKGGRR